MLRNLLLVPFLFWLGGCVESRVPVFSAAEASSPIGESVIAFSSEGATLLVRQDGEYVAQRPDGETLSIRLVPLSLADYIVQIDRGSSHAYVLGELESGQAKIFEFDSASLARELGLANISDHGLGSVVLIRKADYVSFFRAASHRKDEATTVRTYTLKAVGN